MPKGYTPSESEASSPLPRSSGPFAVRSSAAASESRGATIGTGPGDGVPSVSDLVVHDSPGSGDGTVEINTDLDLPYLGYHPLPQNDMRYHGYTVLQEARFVHRLVAMSSSQPVMSLRTAVGAALSRNLVLDCRLKRAGTPIGGNDLWIASHALAIDATLVTNNIRQFSRIDGLRLENRVKQVPSTPGEGLKQSGYIELTFCSAPFTPHRGRPDRGALSGAV